MRRHRTLIVMLVAMTMLAMATTAFAKPPDGKGKPEPSTMEGMTCAERYGDESILVDYEEDATFSLPILGEYPCVDVVNVPPGTWTVDVNVGSARRVIVQLRSSIPGDWCWAVSTKEDTVFTFEDTPASEEDACPFGGAAGDPISDDDPALAFTVVITGSTKTPVEITVTLP